jgi:spermidine/putrescine-binding protein
MLAELDRDALPNADNVDEEFSDPPFDPGSVYSMPYQWGTTGLGVDLEVVGEDAPHSWALLFDPEVTADYQGRMSMLDDPREAMAAALAYLGHDINTTSEDELGEAADLIAETSDRLAAFDSNLYGDLLMSGETAVAHGYSGTFFAAFDEADDPDRYTYVIPEEGGVKWVDTIAILADAPHPCTAHTFINFILDAENGAALTNWTYYASPNAAAEEFIVEDILEDPAIYPPEEVLAELEFLRDTGDAEILYNDLFTRAKS